ncbi:hypothetical protein C4D60_Mb03t18150 [Musa balbisiana]|uniref:Uncharacterized protein n=1 Tax=Musa balbisiana TaxID=52838 RepID=A0A4S8JBU1_MUSBA|nr:hypothetical protein C4D60_Mb03t18150 [Musa balbisiana]
MLVDVLFPSWWGGRGGGLLCDPLDAAYLILWESSTSLSRGSELDWPRCRIDSYKSLPRFGATNGCKSELQIPRKLHLDLQVLDIGHSPIADAGRRSLPLVVGGRGGGLLCDPLDRGLPHLVGELYLLLQRERARLASLNVHQMKTCLALLHILSRYTCLNMFVLKLELLAAKNLIGANLDGTSDSYAIISCGGQTRYRIVPIHVCVDMGPIVRSVVPYRTGVSTLARYGTIYLIVDSTTKTNDEPPWVVDRGPRSDIYQYNTFVGPNHEIDPMT